MRAVLLLPLAVAACAEPSRSPPSLAPRPIERLSVEEPGDRPRTAATVDSAVRRDVQRLLTQASEGERAFRRALAAERSTLRGLSAPEGSDRWATAQTALSAVIASRGGTLEALAALAALRDAEATADDPVVLAAYEEVSALAAAQERELSAFNR